MAILGRCLIVFQEEKTKDRYISTLAPFSFLSLEVIADLVMMMVSNRMSGYVPPLKPWEMTSVIHSLLTLSHYLLKPRGRLVFFLPTDNSAYKEDDIPDVRGMRLVSNSLQDYGKWGRRLITMEKVSFELQDDESEVDELVGGLDRVELGLTEAEREKVGHSGFRDRYFESFQTG